MTMTTVPRLVAVALLGAAVSMGWATDARAKGHGGGGHGGGHHSAGHAPKAHAAPRPRPKLSRTPRARGMKAPGTAHAKTPKPHGSAKPATPHKAATAVARANTAAARPGGATATAARTAAAGGGRGRAASNHYYGAHRSYGRGRMPYRHRSSYGRRNYGQNRYAGAIVSRLRSAHASLARADHDYKGHRVQAMRSVRSAIRQLGHASRRGYGTGTTALSGRANARNTGRRGIGQAQANGQGRRLSQARSDALMRRAQSTLSLVSNHMASQGGTSRAARAFGYVNRAIQHINTALTVR